MTDLGDQFEGDNLAGDPQRPGIAWRTARAAMRRVDAMFSRNGPAFKQLAVSWSANVAGDTLVTIALAQTLFFGVPSADARGNVALYLAITLAPFAVIAPVLGGIFSKFRGVYRAALTLASSLRTLLAVVMMLGLTTLWLYPLAFGMLVLSRLFGISKSSLLPVALPAPVALVSANAVLARIGILAGAVIAPLGALVVQIDPAVGLALSAIFFGISAFTSLGLPNPRRLEEMEEDPDADRYPVLPPRNLRLARLATAGARLLNGFLLLLLAFELRDADAGFLDFGALIGAGGAGYGLASIVSPWLERRLREEPMVVAALAIEAAAAFIAGQFFGLAAAAALAAAAGLAWGTAKFAFDGLLQATVHPDRRGSAFTRSETLFQLAWVVGAILPVTITIPAELGLASAGMFALAAQTVFVSSLLVERHG
ncbi:MAG TPA: hypothetical protein VK960_01725 [Acidimicrobiia bacterium]|nr:hypothetical protein [Acidimicrobiia bacterium]